jgi:hypothetical protein
MSGVRARIGQRHFDRHVRINCGEPTPQERLFLAVCQDFSDTRAAAQIALRSLIEAGIKIFQRVKLLNQHDGGLFTDAFDARDVIDRIAHEPHHLDDLLRRNAELLRDLCRADPAIFCAVEQFDSIGNELH